MSSKPITVELPEGIAREVETLAAESGVTPEQFVAAAAAEKVGAIRDPKAYFAARGARADRAWFERFMSRPGTEPPVADDRVE